MPDNINYAAVYTELKALLEPIGEKLGEGAGFAWDTVVHQMSVVGVGMLMGSVLAYIGAMSLIWTAMKCGKKADTKPMSTYWGNSSAGEWRTSQVLIHIIAVAPFAMGSWLLINGVMHLMNPEFYALEFFMNLVKTNAPL